LSTEFFLGGPGVGLPAPGLAGEFGLSLPPNSPTLSHSCMHTHRNTTILSTTIVPYSRIQKICSKTAYAYVFLKLTSCTIKRTATMPPTTSRLFYFDGGEVELLHCRPTTFAAHMLQGTVGLADNNHSACGSAGWYSADSACACVRSIYHLQLHNSNHLLAA